MGQTTILDETYDAFNGDTGEIHHTSRHTVTKTKMQPEDEFIKVSKYLNVIFAYNNIPLTLVPISLLFAQRMIFKTNELYLLKADKEEIAKMLGISPERVKHLIADCKKYDIIRGIKGSRGKFVVNSFLFSTGNIAETRNLQAKFDFDNDRFIAQADQKSKITGDVIRKTIVNYQEGKKQIPGQMSFDDLLTQKEE